MNNRYSTLTKGTDEELAASAAGIILDAMTKPIAELAFSPAIAVLDRRAALRFLADAFSEAVRIGRDRQRRGT